MQPLDVALAVELLRETLDEELPLPREPRYGPTLFELSAWQSKYRQRQALRERLIESYQLKLQRRTHGGTSDNETRS